MKKQIQRSIALLLLVVTFLASTNFSALAASSGETVYVSTSYRIKQYSDVGTTNANEAGVYWHGGNTSVRFLCLRVGSSQTRTEDYVYCIEPSGTFSNATYTVNGLSGSAYWNSLSAEAQKVISIATMYGFPVNTFGLNKCDGYAATQAIIWEACLATAPLPGGQIHPFTVR